jgi:two-component system, chemotaxis family, chemotaxis protein CheY
VSNYRLNVLNVLLVDDSKSMRSLIRVILQAWGINNVYESEDAINAYARLKEFNVDVVFCDIMMKPMTGIEFTRKVRSDDDSPDPFLPIIVVSGYTERERVEAARDAGATEVMAKPITAKALYTRLVEVVEHPRPFVRAPEYFGPDRRRGQDPTYTGGERRVAVPGTGLIASGKPSIRNAG